MRISLIILIVIHAIIHLFGFLKGFGISEFTAITKPISKPLGAVWLLTFLVLIISVILLIAEFKYWWVIAFIGILLSQFLIIAFWNDAKFGTLANIIILLAIVGAYSSFKFERTVKTEQLNLLHNSELLTNNIITKHTISKLPPAIQKWLICSKIIGKAPISNVRLVQELQLKMKPEQLEWHSGKAEQYFSVHPPAFTWNIKTSMNPVINVVGRDTYENGKGEMSIKLFSLFSVANAKNDKKVNQATLQRYLAEIVWFPSAALSTFISWESIDANTAKATMDYKGIKGSGIFHFDANGNFTKFVAMRYKNSEDTQPSKWTVVATKTEKRNGIRIPVSCKASWEIEGGEWVWLKLKITEIEYNVEKIKPRTNP